MSDESPTFDIPRRPERVYPREGGVEYVGGTIFHLAPDPEASNEELAALVETVLEGDQYTFGDWFDLPAPVYLVHDERHRSAFRVVVRYETVELHVLPETASEALKRLYRCLRAAGDRSWAVECETERGE